MKRIEKVRERRENLIATAAMHRQELGLAMAGLRTPFLLADKAVATVAYVKARPVLLAGAAAAAVVIFRLPRALRLARRGFALWRGARAATTLWTTIQAAINQNIAQRTGRSA